MNKKIKEEWLETLKSDKYIKGSGGLRKDNEYCCLGVLCEIIKDDYNLEWTSKQSIYGRYNITYPNFVKETIDTTADYIPDFIALDFGLTKYNQNNLAGINDMQDDWSGVIEYIEEKL